MREHLPSDRPIMSVDSFAVFGGSKFAYVKAVRSEDVARLYPEAPELVPGLQLFALHAADGTPILITDSRESAIAGAETHALEPVSVH